MTRAEILKAAEMAVNGSRSSYGTPEDNFKAVTRLWAAYAASKNGSREPEDVAVMLILLKIARIATGEANIDNWVDIAGYAACGGELEGKERKSEVTA